MVSIGGQGEFTVIVPNLLSFLGVIDRSVSVFLPCRLFPIQPNLHYFCVNLDYLRDPYFQKMGAPTPKPVGIFASAALMNKVLTGMKTERLYGPLENLY